MHYKTLYAAMFALFAVSFSFPISADAASGPTPSPGWIKLGPTIDNDGVIYLSPEFDKKTGKFSATPESFLDKQDRGEGSFLVGTYRTALSAPIKDEQGVEYDELIASEVIDCQNDYYGTLRTVEKLKGKVVRDETATDDKITMVQTHDWTIDAQLCRLHQGQKPLPSPPAQ